MTDKKKYEIIILIAIAINIGCHLAYSVFDIKCVWYIGNAIAWVMCAYPLYKLLPGIITGILLAATIQQLLDEVVNDPTQNPLIEYVGFIFLIIILTYNVRRRKNNSKINKGERNGI